MQTALHRRYVEMRYDGDRTVSGTVVRYGDIAELPWGLERFERGAFGSVGELDVTLNVMHDRSRLVARSKPARGSARLELIDTAEGLEARATLSDTTDGRDALQMIKDDLLRGMSVEFLPEETRSEAKDGQPMDVQVRAELRGIGLVDRPAYGQSIINPRWRPEESEAREPMDEKEVGELIDRKLEPFSGLLERIEKSVQTLEKRAADDPPEDPPADPPTEGEDAEARADILVMVRELLPQDFETRGKTTHEILVAAAGDEVADAAEQEEAYLRAKVEAIIERRKGAREKLPRNGAPAVSAGTFHRYDVFDVARLGAEEAS